MGAQISKSDLLLTEGVKSGEWTTQVQFGNTIFLNSYSNEQFELASLKLDNEDAKRYKHREKYSFPSTPKVIVLL